MTASPITTAQYAEELATDPRTARKFLRSITPREEQPGKGSRWVLSKPNAATRKQFAAWIEAREARAAADAEVATDATD